MPVRPGRSCSAASASLRGFRTAADVAAKHRCGVTARPAVSGIRPVGAPKSKMDPLHYKPGGLLLTKIDAQAPT